MQCESMLQDQAKVCVVPTRSKEVPRKRRFLSTGEARKENRDSSSSTIFFMQRHGADGNRVSAKTGNSGRSTH